MSCNRWRQKQENKTGQHLLFKVIIINKNLAIHRKTSLNVIHNIMMQTSENTPTSAFGNPRDIVRTFPPALTSLCTPHKMLTRKRFSFQLLSPHLFDTDFGISECKLKIELWNNTKMTKAEVWWRQAGVRNHFDELWRFVWRKNSK